MKKKYTLEQYLFEEEQKQARHKKIKTTIGQEKHRRANINRPVGSEHAGRVGGLTGEQAFKEILNMSVTRVTTRGGDTQTDLDLNVYPGVMLAGGATNPWAVSDNMFGDQYMYQVVGKPARTACEIGFSGKNIYVGRFMANAGWKFVPNSNLDNPGAMKRLIKKANGGSDVLDPRQWTFNPKTSTRNNLRQKHYRTFGQPGVFEQLAVPKFWGLDDIVKLWEAGGDQYFMKLFRSGRIGARLCRSEGAPMRYAILGHKESLEIKNNKGKPMKKKDFKQPRGSTVKQGGKSYEFNWSVLDPDIKLKEVDKDFIYKEIPTINRVIGRTPKSLRWNGASGGQLQVVLRWDSWDWNRCPLLEFTSEAIEIMERAMNALDGTTDMTTDTYAPLPMF